MEGLISLLGGFFTGKNQDRQRRFENKQVERQREQEERRIALLEQQIGIEDQRRQDDYELRAGQNDIERDKVFQADENALLTLQSDPNRMAALRQSNPGLIASIEEKAKRASIARARRVGGAPTTPPPNATFGLQEAAKGTFPSLTLNLPKREAAPAVDTPVSSSPIPSSSSPGIFTEMPGMAGARMAPSRLMQPALPAPRVQEEKPQNVVVPPPTFAQRVQGYIRQGFTPDYAASMAMQYVTADATAAQAEGQRAGAYQARKSGDLAGEQANDLRATRGAKIAGLNAETAERKANALFLKQRPAIEWENAKTEQQKLKLQDKWEGQRNALTAAGQRVEELNGASARGLQKAQADAIYAEIQQGLIGARKEDVALITQMMRSAYPTIVEAGIERMLRPDELSPEQLTMRRTLGSYLQRRNTQLGDALSGNFGGGGTSNTRWAKPGALPKGLSDTDTNNVVAAIEDGTFDARMKGLAGQQRVNAKKIYYAKTGRSWSGK